MGQSNQIAKEDLTVQKTWKIAIVKALFNNHITEKITGSCLKQFVDLGMSPEQVKVFTVAGALEIPLAADWALSGDFDAVVAVGAVIRGETTHYEYVCNGVESGCMQVQLKNQKPIAQAVLTVENEKQALDRCGGSHGDKGKEAADVVVSMLNLKLKVSP